LFIKQTDEPKELINQENPLPYQNKRMPKIWIRVFDFTFFLGSEEVRTFSPGKPVERQEGSSIWLFNLSSWA